MHEYGQYKISFRYVSICKDHFDTKFSILYQKKGINMLGIDKRRMQRSHYKGYNLLNVLVDCGDR